MPEAVCGICALPRSVYKCARCGDRVCLSCYDRNDALCSRCARIEGKRHQFGPRMFALN